MRRLLAFLPLLLALIGCQATPAATSTQVPPTTTGEALQVAATEVAPPASAGPTGLPGKALATFTTAHYSGSGVCSACHTGLVDESGADVSNIDHWRSTMMANASKDPVWLAKVSSEVKRTPGLQAIIEDKCVVCHMPMAEEQLKSEGGQPALFGDGFIAGDNPLHEAAMDGVSCTLCHQIGPQNLGTQESFSGGYLVDGETQRPERLIYGPYENPIAELMQTVSGFRPQHSAHLASSEQCATCHELVTPYVDDEGNILGEFPEQTPYGEWEASSYGASGVGCQTCHMPAAKGGVVVSTMPAGLSPRQPFYQHHFAGGNAQILRVLRDNPDALGTTASAGQFDATIERVRGQLGQAAQVTISDLSTEGTTLTAGIKVSATTGHKFPTSFPSRRAWLHVTVNDAAGRPVFESGKPLEGGAIAGCDADVDEKSFEPHHDVITQPDQVQIYEPIMGDSEGSLTYTLLRAGQYLKDNRLLPPGSDKLALPAHVAVYGSARDDANFVGGSDLVTYQVDLGSATGPFTVHAELLYQPLSYQFTRDLLSDETQEAGRLAQLLPSSAQPFDVVGQDSRSTDQ